MRCKTCTSVKRNHQVDGSSDAVLQNPGHLMIKFCDATAAEYGRHLWETCPLVQHQGWTPSRQDCATTTFSVIYQDLCGRARLASIMLGVILMGGGSGHSLVGTRRAGTGDKNSRMKHCTYRAVVRFGLSTVVSTYYSVVYSLYYRKTGMQATWQTH